MYIKTELAVLMVVCYDINRKENNDIKKEWAMKKTVLALTMTLIFILSACGGSEPSTYITPVFEGEYMVSPEYVKENLDNIILVDARGEAAEGETIKGATILAWQTLATCEDGAPGDENWGVILDTDRLNERLGENGLDPNKEIVLFASSQAGWGDDGRIAWELMAAGYTNVKLVDGGFDMLKSVGLETQSSETEYAPVDVMVETIDETHVINTDELVEIYDDMTIVDVRAEDEYEGATLYGEANGGHLPGAILIEFADLFQENGNLKSNEELEAIFNEAGLSKDEHIVTYCTAGIRSAYMQLVMDMLGYENVQNYDESFYRWSATQEVEV